MKQILKGHDKGHDDFKNEKPKVLHFLEDKGHTAYFLPKFHCELNPHRAGVGTSQALLKSTL